MTEKNRKPINIITILIYVFLTGLAIFYIAPLLWVIMVSIKTDAEVFNDPWGIPSAFRWENFVGAWHLAKLGTAMFNSIFICAVALICSLLVGAMAAFSISVMKWKWAGAALAFFLLGMMIPVHTLLIPLFIVFVKVKLNNTLLGLILPYISFSLPITIFILRGFFASLPKELYEAAFIDGCSIYGCFFRIAFPLTGTGLAVTGLMTFIANWNELLVAMVFNSNPLKRTLPVALTSFVSPYETNYAQMFAAIVIAVLPTIVVYCMFSNKIVAGLTAGAVKG